MLAEPNFRPLPLEAETLLSEGRLDDAIRAVRDAEHIGKRAARKRIDAHLAREPLLRVQLETRQRATRARIFFWFLLIDLVIVAAVIYWLRYRDSI
jgi:hypothetical protein